MVADRAVDNFPNERDAFLGFPIGRKPHEPVGGSFGVIGDEAGDIDFIRTRDKVDDGGSRKAAARGILELEEIVTSP